MTTYTHKDDNNIWLIKPFNKPHSDKSPLQLLRHGDLCRLEHLATRRNLHSHGEPAPMTKKHLQVTGYGEVSVLTVLTPNPRVLTCGLLQVGAGDANDVWRVLIVGGRVNDTVHTVTSRLQFVHYLQNCALTSSGKQLPKWGFEQQEVSCNLNLRDQHAQWNVEDNRHKLCE